LKPKISLSKISIQNICSPIQLELGVTDALAVRLHKDVFRLNGFKIVPKNEVDETCNIYLIKSLPLIKKATFSINGNRIALIKIDFYELLEIVT